MVHLRPMQVEELATYLQSVKNWPPAQAQLAAALSAGRCGRALTSNHEALAKRRDQVVQWLDILRRQRLRGALTVAVELEKEDNIYETLDMMAIWLTDIWHTWLHDGLPIMNVDKIAQLKQEAAAWQQASVAALAAVAAARSPLEQNANRRMVLDSMLMQMQRGLT